MAKKRVHFISSSRGFAPTTKGHSILKKKSYLRVAPTPRTPDFVDYSSPGKSMLVVSTARRKAVPIDDDDYLPPVAGRNALRYSHAALDDNEDVHFRSRRQDEKLLGDITSKLNTMEMENVKPSYGIRQRAGFRKYINNDGPRVSKRDLYQYKKKKEGKAGYNDKIFIDDEEFKPDLSQLNYLQLEDEYKSKARALAKRKVARCKQPSMSERIAYKASMMTHGKYRFSDDPPAAAEALLGAEVVHGGRDGHTARGREESDRMSNIGHMLSQLKSIEDDSNKRRERLRNELDLEAPQPRKRPQQPSYEEDDYDYQPIKPASRSSRVVYDYDDEDHDYRPPAPRSRQQQHVHYEDEDYDYKPVVPATRPRRQADEYVPAPADDDDEICVDRTRSIRLDRIESNLSKTLNEPVPDLFGKYINEWVLNRRPTRRDDDLPTVSVRTREPVRLPENTELMNQNRARSLPPTPHRGRRFPAHVIPHHHVRTRATTPSPRMMSASQAAKRNTPSSAARHSASTTARLAREELEDYEDLIQSRPLRHSRYSVPQVYPGYSYEYEHVPIHVAPTPKVVKTGYYPTGTTNHYRSPHTGRVLAAIEKRLENQITPSFPSAETYVNMRNALSDAKAKMHTHRVIMDRHLPLNLAPLPPVEPEVDRMFNELADRMLDLQPYKTSSSYAASEPSPAYYSKNYTRGSLPKPENKMSDARRHAREVLCRQKRDPHYFE